MDWSAEYQWVESGISSQSATDDAAAADAVVAGHEVGYETVRPEPAGTDSEHASHIEQRLRYKTTSTAFAPELPGL